MARPRPVRRRHLDRRQEGHQDRRHDPRAGAGIGRYRCASPGLVKFGAVASIGGATLAGFDIGTAQQLFHKEGKLDQIRASRAQGVSEQQLLDVDPRDPPARDAGTNRREPGDGRRQRHEELHQLPPELPARLRRHRPVRRRVRDRELALDHDRSAHAGVRHAADARSLAPPGAAQRAPRVDRHRRARLGGRALPRARARQGTVRAVLGGRVHPAEQRPAPEAADDRGRADRRNRRHRSWPACGRRSARRAFRRSPRCARAPPFRRAASRSTAASARASSRSSASPRSRSASSGRTSRRRRSSCSWASGRC